MKVDSHAFRDVFSSGKCEGYALEFDDVHSRAATTAPFVTRKHDDGHPCMFVFESVAAADEERKFFPETTKLVIKKVSVAEVRAFAAIGYFGVPAVVFVCDKTGAITPL